MSLIVITTDTVPSQSGEGPWVWSFSNPSHSNTHHLEGRSWEKNAPCSRSSVRRITTWIQVLSRNENQSKELSELRKKRGRREGGKWERKGEREGRGKKEKKGGEEGEKEERGNRKRWFKSKFLNLNPNLNLADRTPPPLGWKYYNPADSPFIAISPRTSWGDGAPTRANYLSESGDVQSGPVKKTSAVTWTLKHQPIQQAWRCGQIFVVGPVKR